MIRQWYIATLTAVGLALAGTAVAKAPEFPADSTMAQIQDKGKIVIGVKYDIPLFGQRNPLTGKLQGYEIDIGEQLGRDLFGEDGRVEFIEAPGPVREQMVNQRKA